MCGGPARRSAAESKFASVSPPPFQELATGPVSQTGPQRQLGARGGCPRLRAEGLLRPFCNWTFGASSPVSPHPPLNPLPGREGEILTRRALDSPRWRIARFTRVSPQPLVSSEGSSLPRTEVEQSVSGTVLDTLSRRARTSARNQRSRSKARPSKPSPSPRPPSRGPASSSLAREAEIGCAADRRVIIPRHGQRSAGPRVRPGVTMMGGHLLAGPAYKVRARRQGDRTRQPGGQATAGSIGSGCSGRPPVVSQSRSAISARCSACSAAGI